MGYPPIVHYLAMLLGQVWLEPVLKIDVTPAPTVVRISYGIMNPLPSAPNSFGLLHIAHIADVKPPTLLFQVFCILKYILLIRQLTLF